MCNCAGKCTCKKCDPCTDNLVLMPGPKGDPGGWLSGHGYPGDIGRLGDMYLDVDTMFLYKRISPSNQPPEWEYLGNIGAMPEITISPTTGNWVINGHDTGVSASGSDVTQEW